MIQPVLAARLTDSETEYLCELITPREIKLYFQKYPGGFAQLQSGFRAKGLSDQNAINLIVRMRHREFVAKFLNSFIEIYCKEVRGKITSLQETGATAEVALIQALADSSIFCNHVELYFKLEGSLVSEEHIALIKAAVTLLCGKTVEKDGEQSPDMELADSFGSVQGKLTEEREEHTRIQAKLVSDKLATQQELERIQGELSKTATKIAQMQAELDRFHRREEYADIQQESEVSNEYQHTSLCQVVLNSTGQAWLKRLADVYNGRLKQFQIDRTIPYRSENKDWLYRQDGPSTEGFLGIWHWNTISHPDDLGRELIDSEFDHKIKPIEILVLPGCTTLEDISARLLEGISSENLGQKMLISMMLIDEQYLGLLCSIDEFDIQHGIAKLKSSVYNLPFFRVHIQDTLVLSTRIFCRNIALDLPLEIVSIKCPLDLVKDIILSKTTVGILQQQGLGKNEARRCLAYLRSLETSSLYEEVAENYGCSIEDAKKYVSEFIEQAEKTLNGSDISTDVLSAVIRRNSALMSACKAAIYKEWSVENETLLHAAQQALDEAIKEAEHQRQEANTAARQQDNLRQQIQKLQSEVAEKETLAQAVEEKVADRIAKARQSAAEFISSLAFTAPISVQSSGSSGAALSVLVRSVNADKTYGLIMDLSDFEDSLAENLERCGYSEERASELSQILTFCVGQHMPIVCDSNTEVIADCLAAMFGLNGVTVVSISAGELCFSEFLGLLRQEKSTSSPQVYLINGALDAYSPNIFNGILQNSCNMDGYILLFSSEGTPSETLPLSIWDRAMFIDGDIGLIHFPQDDIQVFETKIDFQQRLSPDKLKEKQKQLKRFAQIISNRALLNYARFLAAVNSSIQSDTCILTQILLSTKANGKLEDLLKLFDELEIDVEKAGISKYL